jgi:hypothetical protein
VYILRVWGLITVYALVAMLAPLKHPLAATAPSAVHRGRAKKTAAQMGVIRKDNASHPPALRPRFFAITTGKEYSNTMIDIAIIIPIAAYTCSISLYYYSTKVRIREQKYKV